MARFNEEAARHNFEKQSERWAMNTAIVTREAQRPEDTDMSPSFQFPTRLAGHFTLISDEQTRMTSVKLLPAWKISR